MCISEIFLIIFISSFALTYFIKNFSIKKSILDLPNERSSHAAPIPRGGGLAFIIVFYVLCFLLWIFGWIPFNLFTSLLCGIPVVIIGYCDDLYSISTQHRFIIQVFASIFGVIFLWHSSIFLLLFSIITTAWFINLYNFMDGIDGLAGSEGVFVSLTAGVFLFFSGNIGIGILLFGLAASLIGFLIWNWQPAKIFMGDVGSGFLGYCFAIIMWYTVSTHQLPLMFWGILLAVFLCDATFTLLYRIIQRKSWMQAHREHAYQCLVQHEFTHAQVTLGVMIINCIILFPFAWFVFDIHSIVDSLLISAIPIILLFLLWFFVQKQFNLLQH